MLSDNICLKEWNAVIEALGAGKQSILIRKYKTNLESFLLYPTFSYTRNDDYLKLFKKKYKNFVKDNALPVKEGKKGEIKYYAKVEKVIEKPSKRIGTVAQHHIWAKEHLNSYLKKKSMFIWVLRVYKLKSPILAETNPHAIIYSKLDKRISLENSKPVLSDNEFQKVLDEIS